MPKANWADMSWWVASHQRKTQGHLVHLASADVSQVLPLLPPPESLFLELGLVVNLSSFQHPMLGASLVSDQELSTTWLASAEPEPWFLSEHSRLSKVQCLS